MSKNLDINNLNEICKKDIKKYNKAHSLNEPILDLQILHIDTSVQEMKINMNFYKEQFVKISNVSIENLRDDFDYSHDVKGFNIVDQHKCWFIRTYIFYQLLIFAVKIMSSEQLFNDLYTEKLKKKIKRDNFSYVSDINNKLPLFELGIFGSINPTSDIDVGIKYTGDDSYTKLDYVIAVVEDMFTFILEFKSSLQLDIEPYADMYLITVKGKDIFYLDNSSFEEKDFIELLPYASACILRNYVFSQWDIYNKKETAKNILDKIDYHNFWYEVIDKNNIIFQIIPTIIDELKKTKKKASKMVIDYLDNDYNSARNKYYALVKEADEKRINLRTNVIRIYKNKEIVDIQNKEIVDVSKLTSHALLFRAESYVLPSTIMHVVRTLQAVTPNSTKRKVSYTECHNILNKSIPTNEAICGINVYGYLLSLLEQLGYLYRFKLTYCDSNHVDLKKCDSKSKKYSIRINDAIDKITNYKIQIKGGVYKNNKKKHTQKKYKYKKNKKMIKSKKNKQKKINIKLQRV